jgi:hypothetical protein
MTQSQYTGFRHFVQARKSELLGLPLNLARMMQLLKCPQRALDGQEKESRTALIHRP